LNPYELIMLFNPTLGEEKIGQFVTKVEEKIKGWGGEVEKTEKWGTRRLASMIKKAKSLTQCYYVLVRFKSPSSVPADLRGFLKVSEIVVRYFIARAVAQEAVSPENKEIPGAPVDALPIGEIKGEPLGKPE